VGDLTIRTAEAADRATVTAILTASWGGTTVVVHGTVVDAAGLPALLAERDGTPVGLLTHRSGSRGLEVVTLDAVVPRSGAGSALLAAAAELARSSGARRMWLVTTNDNLDALRFYQRRGLRITEVSPGAADAARAVKPSIPLVGGHGIPVHDELTLELAL
jgi:GNAT superfamily N-acetyltransferase